LMSLEKFAEKSADNLITEIRNKKRVSLERFIYSLGIRHVGEETALDLAGHFKTLDGLKKAFIDELVSIPDIGEKVAQSIYNWFNDKNNLLFLDNLQKSGVEISAPPQKENKVLEGKSFVITGVLEKMSREQAQRRIWESGGKVLDSVGKNTDFLVVGKNPGSKLNRAKKLGVNIISEEEFLKMIK